MKKRKKILLGVIIILLIAWIFWDNVRIGTSHYTVENSSLPDAFNGFKIVQISDLHNASFGSENKRLLDIIQNEKPDIIAITGDIIDSNHTNVDIAIQFVEKAVQIAPVYYVTGNHEAWSEEYEATLKPKLNELGVIILQDENSIIEKDHQCINILGLNDPDFTIRGDMFGESEAMINTKLDEIQPTGFSILLSHRPELFPVYVKHGIPCVLSGHAHGGQFRLPFIGGLIAPDQGFFPKYTAGIYSEQNTKMLVSRGLGESIIPFRINNCPEVVVVKLCK